MPAADIRTPLDAKPSLAPAPPRSAVVLGVPLALTDYQRTLDWIETPIAARSARTSASRPFTL